MLGGSKDVVLAFEFAVALLMGISTNIAFCMILRLVADRLPPLSWSSCASSARRFRVFTRLVASDFVAIFKTFGSGSISDVSGVSGTTELWLLSRGDTVVLGVPDAVVAGVWILRTRLLLVLTIIAALDD
jgi:hypothetical protein